MGLRDTESEKKVAMFDSVTGWAFGPVFDTAEECDAFVEWLGVDARSLSQIELEARYVAFRELKERNPQFFDGKTTKEWTDAFKEYPSAEKMAGTIDDETAEAAEKIMEKLPEMSFDEVVAEAKRIHGTITDAAGMEEKQQ